MKLAVYVPGLRSTPARYGPLLARLQLELGEDWQFRVFEHRIQPWGTEPLGAAAHRLSVQIRTWAGDNGAGEPVGEVLLLGHSLGGLLIRHAYLLDAGWTGDRGHGTYPWTRKVSRIVLFAAPNSGFRTMRMSRWRRVCFAVGAAFRTFSVEELQAGSPYITELRLRWVQAFRKMPDQDRPTVVQVLGDHDDLVRLDDSLDVEFMADATRVDVPGATHGGLIDLSTSADPEERYAVLRHAILDDFTAERLKPAATSGQPVYFILHGIRAGRYANWVGQLAQQLTRSNSAAVVYTPSYGYLSAAEFAIPFTRSRNLRNFLDWYSRLFVTHSPENLHFAGHSNGTYLFGQALLRVPAMRFNRVYLAGSVLPREYPWSTIAEREQIAGVVHSDRATKDWPVGWLCSALGGLGMRDVGTGGFAGFDQATQLLVEHNHAFPGGHGAAVTGEQRLAEVAAFLSDGTADHEPDGTPNMVFALISRVARVVAKPAVAAAVVLAVLWVVSAETGAERLLRVGEILLGGFVVLAVGRAV